MKDLKVVKITKNTKKKVYDLSVNYVQHYITDNGVINHNSGLVYGASVILNMSKAKLKDNSNDKEQSGIIVTAKPQKNRFCVPRAIKFHISFQKGMNEFVGLQEYMSWDKCGVGRGKFITEKEYQKLSDSDKDKCRQHPMDSSVYFYPSDSGRYICTDFQLEPIAWREVCSSKVWTNNVIKRLDENVIKHLFSYSDINTLGDIDEIINNAEKEEDELI